MKKFGLIFVMVVLTFGFIGCDNGITGVGGNRTVAPEFRGTFVRWSSNPGPGTGGVYVYFVFTENSMREYSRGRNDQNRNFARESQVWTDGNRLMRNTADGSGSQIGHFADINTLRWNLFGGTVPMVRVSN